MFREYDIRGVAETDLAGPDIELLGRGLGTYIERHSGKRVNVGRDVRLSSTRLRDAMVSGLMATGCEVTDIGVVPTPVLYYSAQYLKADGAVMITGSHNPAEYNGVKTMCGEATLHGESIQAVRELIGRGDFLSGAGGKRGCDMVTPYVDEAAAQFSALPRRVKLVADAGNGCAGPVIHRILQKINVDAEEMYFEMDGRFPNHHPDPAVPANLADLSKAVRARGAELGIAFDGDSDRIGAVDGHGDVIYGDMLPLIYGREILTRKPGATFIGEVKCLQVMYDELNRLGGRAVMYMMGHSLIKAKMKPEHAELAGEMSGHMFFGDHYRGYDDALYAACRLIEIVARSGRPLSAQLEGLPKMVSTPEIRVDCADDIKFDAVARVAAEFQKTHKVVDIDGARVLFEHGWGLVRASNTQPVLVMRFEAETDGDLKRYQSEVERVVEEARNRTARVS